MVLVCSPDIGPLIAISIVGFAQSQNRTARTMITWFPESQTLIGRQFPSAWQTAQIFSGTLALQRTLQGLDSRFNFKPSVFGELGLNNGKRLAAREIRKVESFRPLPCPAVRLNIPVQVEAEAAEAEQVQRSAHRKAAK